MPALVIKEWKASDQPIDPEGHFVRIVGRGSGLLSWFLSLLKIDPTTSISISQDRIEISTASLSGTTTRIIPVGNISSTYYGYHKPWKMALTIFFSLATFLNIPGFLAAISRNPILENLGWFIGLLVAAAAAIFYYYISRTLALGFIELSGVKNAIVFKPSIIEQVVINEIQARYICELVQCLIEADKKPILEPAN